MTKLNDFKFFDSHFHIIDPAFPLFENQGFVPDYYTINEYQERLSSYQLAGGAIVSGSFQGLDQSYLSAALKTMGPGYVGVTQLDHNTSDEEILALNAAGVRGTRFNLKRGVAESLDDLEHFAKRIYELAGWHIELYIDSKELAALKARLLKLPSVSIAHFGLSAEGFSDLLALAEKGVQVKATGYGRVNFPIAPALKDLTSANPDCLMFGSDLPCTRTPHLYSDEDFLLVIDTLGPELAQKVFYDNAANFYKPAVVTD